MLLLPPWQDWFSRSIYDLMFAWIWEDAKCHKGLFYHLEIPPASRKQIFPPKGICCHLTVLVLLGKESPEDKCNFKARHLYIYMLLNCRLHLRQQPLINWATGVSRTSDLARWLSWEWWFKQPFTFPIHFMAGVWTFLTVSSMEINVCPYSCWAALSCSFPKGLMSSTQNN